MSKEQINFWLEGERTAGASSFAVGQIVAFAGSVAPSKWLLCDGGLAEISVFPELYALIGTAYMASPPAGTFAIPNLQTRFPFGAGEGFNLHTTGGANNFTIAQANLPAVSLAVSGTTSTNTTGITATLATNSTGTGNAGIVNNPNCERDTQVATTVNITDGGHAHTITGTTANLGTGTAVAILPSYSVVNYIIYTGVVFP
jgi:microcystin-dependent protein